MSPEIRSLILKRIEEIRTTFGKDRFGPPKRKDPNTPKYGYWVETYDFSKLDDENLLIQFERLIMLSYRLR